MWDDVSVALLVTCSASTVDAVKFSGNPYTFRLLFAIYLALEASVHSFGALRQAVADVGCWSKAVSGIHFMRQLQTLHIPSFIFV